MVITTRSGKVLVKKKVLEEDVVDENMQQEKSSEKRKMCVDAPIVIEEELESSKSPSIQRKENFKEKEKDERVPQDLKPIPSPPPPFSRRLEKKMEEGKFKKFLKCHEN